MISRINDLTPGLEAVSDSKIQITSASIDQTYRIREKLTFKDSESLKKHLNVTLLKLREWQPRYDFSLWNQVEVYFYKIWPTLKADMRLAIENNLYKEVKSLFLEVRNLLQWTGEINSRIYYASWLRKEAIKREDVGTQCIAVSSLTWSFTSSGHQRNLAKANYYLKELEHLLLSKSDCDAYKDLHLSLRASLGNDLYAELMMDAHENAVRVQIRNRDLSQAKLCIDRGTLVVESLINRMLISPRLKERFLVAFKYHLGIISYITDDYAIAEHRFKDIEYQAKQIGWVRVVKGAESWLAKLAFELSRYDDCSEILDNLIDKPLSSLHYSKRDGICFLLKAQLLHKQGFRDKEIESEKEADRVLKKFLYSENSADHRKANIQYKEFLICS